MKKIWHVLLVAVALLTTGCKDKQITFRGVVEQVEDQMVLVSVLEGAEFDKASVAISSNTKFAGTSLEQIKKQDQLIITISPKIAESYPVQVKAVKITMAEQNKEATKAVYHKIDPKQAKEMMDQEEVIILDVRTPEEYAEGHIPKAVLLPDYDISKKAGDQFPDKAAKILVYCRSGRRSAASAKELVKLGYTAVYDFGGIIDWPYEVEK